MQFAQAEALTWLFALIPCTAAFVAYVLWKRRQRRAIGHEPMIAAMAHEVSATRQIASAVMTLLGLTSLIVALAQPQWGQTDQVVKRSGIDVVFALDLSRSMLARDVSPSRLDAAKKEITTALGQLAGDRAGLVVFTSVSFAQSPLTNDYGALRFYLRKLDPAQMPFGGTSIGRALSDGVDLLTGHADDDASAQRAVKRAKNQIIVLITDGEDHESDPMASAKQAEAQQIHVVTVGFGSSQGERIPTFNEDGTLSGYTRNRSGEVVYSKLDDVTLKKIASQTGGVYIPYEGENSVAYALLDYINALEKSELEAMMKQRYEERFYLFVVPAVLLLLLGFLLGDRRRPRSKRVGQGGAPPERNLLLATIFLAIVSTSASTGCEDALEREVAEVARANRLLAEGDPQGALTAYQRASETLPASPRLAYNMGRAQMELDDQLATAQEDFARALETDDPHLRFDALYNLGLVLAAQQKWQQAFETFQQALLVYALRPEWVARSEYADAVFNMEAAWQKLFPPCSTLEDDLEENDSPAQAKTLEALELKDRTLCGGDDDDYALQVVAGTRLTVRATFKDLREVLDPERAFLPRAEDVQIAIFDRSGERVVAVDQGARPEGDLSAEVERFSSASGERSRVRREIIDLILTEEMIGAPAGELILHVKAADEREFSYDVEIELIPPCDALEEALEPNDDASQAKTIEPGQPMPLHLCPGNEDWFAIEASAGDTIFVDLQPGQDIEREAPTEATFELRDEQGEVIAEGAIEEGFVTAALWEVPEAARYTLRVFHPEGDGQGPYSLSTYRYEPCGEARGDDRLEENNAPQSATPFDEQTPAHRYLRACPGDEDLFLVALPEPDAKDPQRPAGPKPTPLDSAPNQRDPGAAKKPRQLALTLTPVYRDSTPRALPDLTAEALDGAPLAEEQDEPRPQDGEASRSEEDALSLALLDLTGERVLLEAPRAQDVEAPRAQDDSSDSSAPSYARLLSEELFAETALVRVRGEATFYHLSRPEGGGSSSDQDEEQSEQDGEDQESGDQGEEEQDQDGQEGEQEGEQEEEEQGEEGEQGEQPSDEAPEQEGDSSPPSEQAEQGEQSEQPPQAEQSEMRRVEDILRALERSDDNFQMRKALENAPGRYIEKDW